MNRNYANQMIRFRFGEQCQINTSLFIDLQQKNQFYTKQTEYAKMKNQTNMNMNMNKTETQVMQFIYTQKTKPKTKMSQNEPKKMNEQKSLLLLQNALKPNKLRKHFKPLKQKIKNQVKMLC